MKPNKKRHSLLLSSSDEEEGGLPGLGLPLSQGGLDRQQLSPSEALQQRNLSLNSVSAFTRVLVYVYKVLLGLYVCE